MIMDIRYPIIYGIEFARQSLNFRFGAQPLGVFIVCNNFGLRMI